MMVLVDCKLVEAIPPTSNFIAVRPKAALLFWFLVILDVMWRYLLLFLLYIKIDRHLQFQGDEFLNGRLCSSKRTSFPL